MRIRRVGAASTVREFAIRRDDWVGTSPLDRGSAGGLRGYLKKAARPVDQEGEGPALSSGAPSLFVQWGSERGVKSSAPILFS